MNILVLGKLDEAKTIAQLNTQLGTLKNKIEAISVHLKLDADAIRQIQTILTDTKSLTSAFTQQSSAIKMSSSELDKYVEVFQGLGMNIDKMTAKKREWTDETGRTVKQIQFLDSETGKVVKTIEEVTNNFKQQRLESEKLAKQVLKDQVALANAMGRGKDQSFNRQRAADRSSELKQADAINRAIERENELKRTRVGLFPELKGQQVSEIQLTQVLNQLYADREIRAISVDRVTGRWSATLAENSAQNRVLKGTIDSTTGALHKQSEALTQVKNRNLGMMDEIGIALKRIPTWFISMTLYVQTMRFFKDGFSYVNDLNKSLTEISIVTGKNQTQVTTLGVEYQKLAYQMAVTTKEITEASVTFYRQGLTQEEVMERVRIATQYAKIANVEFAQASEILTATVNSLNIPIERAADVMAYLGDATATGADEIGIAMQKVGGSTAAANLEYEKMASWIALISSKTREGADAIGTSLRNILARFTNLTKGGFDEEDQTRINDVAVALNEVGISITEQSGKFRNFGDVLDEVGSRWDEIKAREDNVAELITFSLAGARQKDRLLNLLNSYGESVELYEGALIAAGTTQQKYNKYLQSTEGYLSKLKTSYTGIWQEVFNSEDIRSAITVITHLTNALGFMIKAFGFLPVVVPVAIAVMTLFNAKVLLAVKTTAAWTAMMMGLPGSPIWLGIAAIAALTVVITKTTGALSKMSEANRVANMEEKNAVETYKKHGSEIEKLNTRYKELSNLTSRTAKEDAELETVKRRLAQILPSVTTALDAHGNVHIRTAEKIDEELIKVRELLAAYDNLDKKLKEQESKRAERQIKSTQDTLLQLQRDLSGLYANPDLYPEDEMRTREQYLKDEITRLSESLGLLREKAELTKDVASIITPEPDPNPTGIGTTNTPTIFDLSLRKIELVDAELAKLQHSLELVTSTEERQTIYDQMIVAYKQKQTLLSQMLTWQKQEMANAQTVLKKSVNANDYRNIINGKFDNLPVYSQAVSDAISKWQSLSSEVLKTESSLREVELATISLGETSQKEIADNYSKWLSDTTQVANDVVDAYKEMYRQQKDLRLKENREAMDAENERHKKVMDNLSDQLDAYTDIINAKLKTLDREEDADSYQKDLTAAQTERQDLLNKIDILGLDDSVESRAKLAELNKELAEKDINIAEMRSKRESDLRKQSLTDQLDTYKADIEAKKETEDSKFEAAKLNIEQERDAWTNYYDNLIGDEKRWSIIRQSIMDGDKARIDSILTDLQNKGFPTMVSKLDADMIIAGKSIQENLIDKLAAAQAALSGVNYNVKLPTGVGNVGGAIPTTPAQTTDPSLREYASKQGVPIGYNEATDMVTFGSKSYSKSQLESLGLYLKNGNWYGSGGALSKLVPFHGGGRIPNLPGSGEGLALVQKKEGLLKEGDTSNLVSAIRLLDNIIPRFNTPQVAGAGIGGGITLNFNVDKLYGTDKEAKGFSQKIVSELTKSGIMAPVRRGG